MKILVIIAFEKIALNHKSRGNNNARIVFLTAVDPTLKLG